MAKPVISIIGTIFNQAKAAERALDIWCRQKFDHPYEIIVLDDGSTDETRKMVAGLQERYPDLIRYFYFNASHFTRNCTLLFNTAIRRLIRSEIAVIQWYDRIPGSFDALTRLYDPHLENPRRLVTFLTRHIAGSSSREVFAEQDVDRLLDSVPWRDYPESLSKIMGTPGRHCYPHTMNESACFSVRREHLETICGYDERYYKVANYSNIELYGRLKNHGLEVQILDEYTFHQPHPSNRDDIQVAIEPDNIIRRNLHIRQKWGSIVPDLFVQPDRKKVTIVIPSDDDGSLRAQLASQEDIEVIVDDNPDRALRKAAGRIMCYVFVREVDLPDLLARASRLIEDERAVGCVGSAGGRLSLFTSGLRLGGGKPDVVCGDYFLFLRKPAIANGLAFMHTPDVQASLIDFSKQMEVWAGRKNESLGSTNVSGEWKDESLVHRWNFLFT